MMCRVSTVSGSAETTMFQLSENRHLKVNRGGQTTHWITGQNIQTDDGVRITD